MGAIGAGSAPAAALAAGDLLCVLARKPRQGSKQQEQDEGPVAQRHGRNPPFRKGSVRPVAFLPPRVGPGRTSANLRPMRRITRGGLCLLLLFCGLARAEAPAVPGHQAFAAGQATFELTGDGRSPLRTQILVTNRTAAPLRLHLGAGTVFAEPQRQDVMLVEERVVDLPPRGAAKATVGTLCVGARAEEPPGPQACVFTPQPPAEGGALALYRACQALSEAGRFPDLPLPKGRQVPTVAQLALWAQRGELTREVVRENVFDQLDLTEKDATPEQRQEVDRGVDHLWQAVDLTLKESPQ